jgi:hypothetical protein
MHISAIRAESYRSLHLAAMAAERRGCVETQPRDLSRRVRFENLSKRSPNCAAERIQGLFLAERAERLEFSHSFRTLLPVRATTISLICTHQQTKCPRVEMLSAGRKPQRLCWWDKKHGN